MKKFNIPCDCACHSQQFRSIKLDHFKACCDKPYSHLPGLMSVSFFDESDLNSSHGEAKAAMQARNCELKHYYPDLLNE